MLHFFMRGGVVILAMLASYFGSMQFRSTNPQDFVIGGGVLVISILVIFLFTRRLWKHFGCFTTLGLIAILMGGMVFFVAGPDMFKNLVAVFTGKTAEAVQNVTEAVAENNNSQPEQQVPAEETVPQQPQFVTGNIQLYKAGDTFVMQGYVFKIYAIASPLREQHCNWENGMDYECGTVSAQKLKEFVENDPVTCRVISINKKGEVLGACSIKDADGNTMDLGAYMVEEGWALALPDINPIYSPYQERAQQNKKGLWAGTFLAPWQWVAEQNRIRTEAAQVKVPKIKIKAAPLLKKGKSIFDHF